MRTAKTTCKTLGLCRLFVWTVALACGAAYAYQDDLIETEATPTVVTVGCNAVYVFSNAVDVGVARTITARKGITLVQSFAVGGGGAGGSVIGGGGGGGGVVDGSTFAYLSAGSALTISVGAGGVPAAASNWDQSGSGGPSTVVRAGETILAAYGGGGGGGYSCASFATGSFGSSGGGGGNKTPTITEGSHWTSGQGHAGAQRVSNDLGGGGGGAGAAASGANGGEGRVSYITGTGAVYGAGGGGASRSGTGGGTGGTHAGDGGETTGLPGDAGFGGGGGAGSFKGSGSYAGGAGGSGVIALVFAEGDHENYRFEIQPIPDTFYLGTPYEPDVIVSNPVLNVVLTKGVDYDVTYTNNNAPGTATVTATGRTGTNYAGFSATQNFVLKESVIDDNLVTDDTSVRHYTDGEKYYYVFTNGAATATISIKRTVTISELLLVGGGGAGGDTDGGGGGGGAVVTGEVAYVLVAGKEASVRVGAGGVRATVNSWGNGGNGGHTTFSFGTTELIAYGGGGGGGYQKRSPSEAVVSGEIASGGGSSQNGTVNTDGLYYNSLYGHCGAKGSGGGGGGAYSAGSGTHGGEGLTNSISGTAEVYGSGGGGGIRDANYGGYGGTNAGDGSGGSENVNGRNGRDGYGAGGGGGGYKNNGSGNPHGGGNGGSGTVVIVLTAGGSVGQPTIESAAITYPNGYTQPQFAITLGNEKSHSYQATIEVDFYETPGTVLKTLTIGGVAEGVEQSALLDFCVQPGATLYADITVTADGAETRSQTVHAQATGTVPPSYGHGGGTHVIHVRPGATGRNDGSDWFNAYTDFRDGLAALSADRTEVWFAGDETITRTPSEVTLTAASALYGGFTGVEDSVFARAAGARSTIDGSSAYLPLQFVNSAALTIDGFRLRHGSSHLLEKSGSGDITVTNCVFCDASGGGQGRGAYLTGSASTVARFADVAFRSIFGGGTFAKNTGTVMYLASLGRVFIDRCSFMTNGCYFSTGFNNTMYDQNGAVIYASGAPLTVRNAVFRGNRSQALQGGGGVIALAGNCGTTAFTNCLFVGNEVIHGYQYYNIDGNLGSLNTGMFVSRASAGSIDIENCTFAHGLATVNSGAAGLTFRGAANATVRNSIFYGNTNGANNVAGYDIHVDGTAQADISYCLFEDASTNRITCGETAVTNYNPATFVYGNPLFVTESSIGSFITGTDAFMLLASGKLAELCALNVHLRSRPGYVDEVTGRKVRFDRASSPAIDAGDPASPYALESDEAPIGTNGRRVNLGFYGNTPYATKTLVPGSRVLVR